MSEHGTTRPRDLPTDLMEAVDAAREFEIPYTRIRTWYQRGRIMKYVRGDKRVFVSRAEVARMLVIEPQPAGQLAEQDTADAEDMSNASEERE